MACNGPKQNNTDREQTCRVCMRKSNVMRDLFNSNKELVQKIQFCTGILLIELDNLPNSICPDCVSQLDIAHNFKSTCIRSENKFQTLLNDVKVELKCEDTSCEDISHDSFTMKEEWLVEDDIIIEYNGVVDEVIEKRLNSRKRKKRFKFKRLFCEICNLKFTNKQESQIHYLTHKPEKWICEICGKQFVHHASLYSHMMAHGAPTLECAHCDYSTGRKTDLIKHLKLHTGEKNFICHACPGAFRTSSNLHGHILRQHGGQKRHPCPRCEKAFFDRSRLRRHLDAHDNVKRYECDVCHSCFTRRSHWKVHLLKQHAVQIPRLRPGRRRASRASLAYPETHSIFNNK